NIPALAVAIVEGGQVIDHAVVGVREAGTDVAAQVDDLFHIGSIGKSMTATLLGRLVELEALRWDTTISNIVR
ncbi:MAG: serine hydrolase, partial [Gammaproteobacteria bacterium]|nr:serine hydrolase [Gammaproteobacteria bacterium]